VKRSGWTRNDEQYPNLRSGVLLGEVILYLFLVDALKIEIFRRFEVV
jgi:hypothetical protein